MLYSALPDEGCLVECKPVVFDRSRTILFLKFEVEQFKT